MKLPAILFLALSGPLFAQGVNPEMLLSPPPSTWPGYHGDYSGRRHSALTRITPENVGRMGLAWAYQTGQVGQLKCSPLLVDGVLYITVPNNVWAVDARSGHQIWHYAYPPNKGFHIGSRGVSMYKDWLFFMTPDAHLISLNANDGTVRWNIAVADSEKGYWTTMSPLIVRNHVIVGVSGDFDNLTGFLKSIDPETGKTQWRWDSTPPAGTPNATTGGMTWMTGTYDPALNLIYWGTGNPTPVLTAKTRPGDNLYTCSIVALNPDTGKLSWAFQPSPHDTHDWDAVEVPVLVDADFGGKPRKMLMQASRNGYFFVLDRTNGQSLLTTAFGPVNWSTGIDQKGQPVPNPDKEPAPDGRLIAPDEGGLTNYRSPSFDPQTGLFLVDAHPAYGIYFAKPADGTFRLGRRRLRRLGQRRARSHRLPDRQDPLEPRARPQRLRRRSAHHRFRIDLHRRQPRQRSRPPHRRRQNLVACGRRRLHAELSHHLRAGRPPVRGHQRRRRTVRLGVAGGVTVGRVNPTNRIVIS